MRKALNRAFSVAVLASAIGTCAIPVLGNEASGHEQLPFSLPTPTCLLADAGLADAAVSDVLKASAAELPASEAVIGQASDSQLKTDDSAKEAEAGQAKTDSGNQAEAEPMQEAKTEPSASEKPSEVTESQDEPEKAGEVSADKAGVQAGGDTAVNAGEKAEASGEAVSEPASSPSKDVQVNAAGQAEASEKSDTAVSGDKAASENSEAKADNKEASSASEGSVGEDVKAPSGGSASAVGVCLFGGVVKEITPDTLTIEGTASNGEPLELEFIVDNDSELAVGVKKDDRVVVYYEETEKGGYRVTSARYVTGDFPRNVFPADLALQKAEAERKKAELSDDDDNDDEDVIASKVVSIEIEGNSATTADEILKVVSTRVGDPILDPRIRRDMQAVYDTGYFTDVRLDTRYAPGGVRLVFRVLENPIVQGIEIEGNKVADTETLLSLMQTEPGKILNTRVLQSDLQAINKYYNDDLNYTVSPSHITGMEIKDGILRLTVIDGMVIEKVEVNGVTVFPQDMVNALVTSKPGELFNRKKASEDADAIAALY
ncbi:hypothetical protein IJT17_06330, partial [bacterium]|nr:hypothetical protein [bacterium]